jgi:hypothetical protein
MGVIFADFHQCGSLLSSIDLLNIFATGVAMLSIVSLTNFGYIESDPCDFVSFIFCRCFFTVSTSNLILSSFKSVLELKVGMVSFSGSFVKTLWKNAFRSWALHLFSVCISPLSSMMH